MLTQIDVERLPAYRRVMEKGMERGMERGIQLGQGKGEVALLTRLLGYKFGALPSELRRRMEGARPEEVALWEQRVLSAQTLDEVFS
uniref:DUF4351 domain-containing protein n=1 Tax=Candidatus Kentrum sp. DK TaxID=2126562 RepID=A0A450TIT1_9GAMM|nr:MAG: hypothetical protein BECKDK2373C_GA0170839_11622 [Candidatus Kentron sp. DK]